MNNKQYRSIKWDEQNGICPLCNEQIKKAQPKLGKRGKPLKSFDRLGAAWLMRIRQKYQGGAYALENFNLVHGPCGQRFQEWLGAKPGREYIKSYIKTAEFFKTGDIAITRNGVVVHIANVRPGSGIVNAPESA